MDHLVKANILDITPYKPGKPIEEIQREFGLKKVVKLASNENCRPIPEHVRRAINEELDQIHLYPDSDSYYARQKIAAENGVTANEVIIGAGTVEIIRMILSTFLNPGETVLTSEKTFPLYRIVTTEIAGTDAYIEAPMDDAFCFDLEQIHNRIDKRTKIIILTNPNNPTGTSIPGKAIQQFIESTPADKLILLDNAYQEYVDGSSDFLTGIPLFRQHQNVIALRTFSKIYGLAGLRIGYGIAQEGFISLINRLRLPFNVSRIAQRAAIASLENDVYKTESAALNRKNRSDLETALKKRGYIVLPSQTNFLLFFPGMNSAAVFKELLREGVIIRPSESFRGKDSIRVTVGLSEENQYFLEKLDLVTARLKPKS